MRRLLYNAISGMILLCSSPIFVITREEWEETSACQLFEERRKETTKGRALSHKGFPIWNLQLFLFREPERPVLSQAKSGSQSNHWSFFRFSADLCHTVMLFLLCTNLFTVSEPSWVLSFISRCLGRNLIRDGSFWGGVQLYCLMSNSKTTLVRIS